MKDKAKCLTLILFALSFTFLLSCRGRTIDYEERNKRLGISDEQDSTSNNNQLQSESWSLALNDIEVVDSGIYKLIFQSYYVNSQIQGVSANLEYLIDLTKAEAFNLMDFSQAQFECEAHEQGGHCSKGYFLVTTYVKSQASYKTARIIFNFNKEAYELQSLVASAFQKIRPMDYLELHMQSDVGSLNEKMEFIVDSQPTPQTFFYSRNEEDQNTNRIRSGFSFFEEDIFRLEYSLRQMSISILRSTKLTSIHIKRSRRNIFTGAEDALHYRLVKAPSAL